MTSSAALKGGDSSLYGCLRTPRNERHHEDLSRGAALTVLTSLQRLARCAEALPV